ncbi:hypothetical protein DSO57_1031216 [Entomophthora muscae]|uniref:Uncharacterized protein n=1 Tax=Entomophthora muscae TaxID=34485 RepID=A0ACC2S2L6_9FUNG|nr:hypothetical protein DSO57_1031216 [Entomophthora muscae]
MNIIVKLWNPHINFWSTFYCDSFIDKPPADSTDITKQPFATLFVSRLSPSTTEKMIEDEFSKYGKIISVKIVRNIVTGKSYCRAAYKDSRRRMVDGQFILVDYERSRVMKDWKPRRLGGGLSGRIESGQLRFGGKDRPFKIPYHRNGPKIPEDQFKDDCWRYA